MKRQLMHLWKMNKRIIQSILTILILSAWIYWDIDQAHSSAEGIYKSFFNAANRTYAGSNIATVSIVRSNDPSLTHPCSVTDEGITYLTISEMVQRAVNLAGGLNGIVKSGDTVLIKPNMVQQDSSGSGGVTDVRVVKALVYMVDAIDHGHIKIIVGDGSPRPYTTFEKASGTTARAWKQLFDVPGYQQLKTEALAAGVNFKLSNLNGNNDTTPWPELDSVNVPGGGYASPQGGHYYIHQDVIHASVYITVPVMKIHDQPGYTGALKNQIGLAASTKYGFNKTTGVTQEGRYHKLLHQAQLPYNWQDKEIVDLSILARIKLNVIDAITCLDIKKTPTYTSDSTNINIQNRVKMNTIIAGYDPVAVDNVCCRIMGMNPDDIEHITLAERAGLGTNNSDSISVVGTSIAATRRVFRKGQSLSAWFGQSNRIWLLNGPYSTTGISTPMDYEFVANEDSLSPAAGANGWSQPIYFTNDQIALKDYYGLGSQSVVSYAFTYFNAPASQAAELWVGSDEAMKIYLNGQVVYNYTGTRTLSGTAFWSEIVSINVHQGMNTLLVKTYQGTGSANTYTFSLNICEVQPDTYYKGNRILGLKFTTDAPQQTTSISEALGWNLASVPRLQPNYTPVVVFPGCYGDVFKFDPTINGYVTVPTLALGTGYWVYYTNAANITITGAPVSGPVQIACQEGWNLIGSREVPIATSALTVSAGAIYGDLFRFDTVTGTYVITTSLAPGEATWVYVTQACTLTIP
jgi:uncharacterized protein (DUF362 family)